MLKTKSRLLLSENEKMSRKQFFLLYSFFFAIIAFAIFYLYMKNGVTFVRKGDGFTQHYTALVYYGKWLRSIVDTLISEHKLVIPNWDFSMGLGSDVVTTLNYYVIGDPLTLLSALVPVKYTAYLYTFLCVLRYYLTGICFSLYCFERKHNNVIGVLVSSFTFTFCCYALYAGTKHPYFLNPMIYLPLILISVERIFKNKNPIYLALIVCVAEVSNFYFFYVLVIATVVYVLIRLVEIYKADIKAMIAPLFRIAVSSVIGVLLGAIVFLPAVLSLLGDSRMGVAYDYPLLYDLGYYLRLPSALISYDGKSAGWTLLGYSVIVLFSLVALFTAKKKYTFLKAFVVIGFVGFLTPVFGGFANGFSYSCNRWGFVFSFIVAYVVSATWDEVFQTVSKKRIIAVSVIPVIFTALCFLTKYTMKDRMVVSTLSVVLISAGILVCGFVLQKKSSNLMFLKTGTALLSIACIITNGYFASGDSSSRYYSPAYLNNYVGDDVAGVRTAAKAASDDSFFRFSGDDVSRNGSVNAKLSSTQYYWSLSNGSISDFHDSISLNEAFYQLYDGFDDITSLNTLAGVKYYYDDPENDNNCVPYGFSPTDTENIYVNDNTLPLGYTYDGYVTRAEYDALETSLDKQQMLLQAVVLEEGDSFENKAEPEYVTKKLAKKMIVPGKNVEYEDKTFTVSKDGAKIAFKIEKEANSELYISVKDIGYTDAYSYYDESTDTYELYTQEEYKKLDSEKKKAVEEQNPDMAPKQIVSFFVGAITHDKELISGKSIHYLTPEFDFCCGKTSFDANLGYSEDGYEYIVFNFPYAGVYTFSDISFYTQTMDVYDEAVKELSKETLQNISITTDKVTGNISVSDDKLLCFSIPYSKGWTAYVDGVETELMKANVMYMALEISEGDHEIELVYSNSNIKLGAIITIFGLLLLFAYYMWYYIGRKKKRITFKEID